MKPQKIVKIRIEDVEYEIEKPFVFRLLNDKAYRLYQKCNKTKAEVRFRSSAIRSELFNQFNYQN